MSLKFSTRHFSLINILPIYPKWKTVKTLSSQLEDSSGEVVTSRTIQRDLENLSGYGITRFSDSPDGYKWSLDEDALHTFAQMSPADALCFVLINKFASPILPGIISPYLGLLFNKAENTLNQLKSHSKLKKWVDKVYLEASGQPLLPAEINEDVKSSVYEALLYEKLLDIEYKKKNGEIVNVTAKPLGIVVRSHIQYLIIEYKDLQEYRMLALNRMIKVTSTNHKFTYPDYFNLTEYVNSGSTGFAYDSENIAFEAIFKGFAADLVSETPICLTQTSQVTDKGLHLTANIKLNYDFESWILGLAEYVEIIQPVDFSQRIKKRLTAAYQQYNSNDA